MVPETLKIDYLPQKKTYLCFGKVRDFDKITFHTFKIRVKKDLSLYDSHTLE